MKINRSNYEIVFIDYFDGKLDKNREDELFQFLKENPDLKNEFDLFSGTNVEPDLNLKYPGKEVLKKDLININNYKTWFVAYVEKDLSGEGIRELEKFLKDNPVYASELEIFNKTKLTPDHSIILDKKNSLKRGTKVIQFSAPVKRIISIAAVLLFVALTYFIINQFNSPKTVVSDNNNVPVKSDKNDNSTNTENNLAKEDGNDFQIQTEKKSVTVEQLTLIENKNNIKSTEKTTPKEIQAGTDSLKLQKPEDAPQLAETLPEKINDQSNINGINGNINVKVQKPVINAQMADLTSNEYAEIFSDDELKDLKAMQNKKLKKTDEESKQLVDIAKEELNKLSKMADIKFAKQNDTENNSVTYAFGIGKNFSISHTSGKQ